MIPIRIFLLLLCCCCGPSAYLQTPPSAWIEVNSVRAAVRADGYFFGSGLQVPSLPAVTNDKRILIHSMIPWISGLDPGGNLKVAACAWNGINTDFRAGLRGKPGYDRIWRVTKAQIVQHTADFKDNGIIDEPIEAIMNWPESLGFDDDGDGVEEAVRLNPFSDDNFNGVYEPQLGDYLYISCNGNLSWAGIPDEILFFAFHDSSAHTYSKAARTDLQMLCTVFAYNCPEWNALNRSLFIYLKYWNRGTEMLDSASLSMFIDFDIGGYDDDYLGTDTLRHMVYAYNGDAIDEGLFGQNPPMAAVTMITSPLDAFGNWTDVVSMPIYKSPIGATVPQESIGFYNYTHALWRDGSPLRYEGTGYAPLSGAKPVHHAFPGVPGDPAGWSELSAANKAGERIAVLSHQPVRMQPGEYAEMLLAVLWSHGEVAGPLSGYPTLLTDAGWIRERCSALEDPIPWMPGCLSFTVGTPEEPLPMGATVFPLPADERIWLNIGEPAAWSMQVYDAVGREVFAENPHQPVEHFEVDTRAWPAGMYWIRVSDDQGKIGLKKVVIHHH